MLQFSGPLRPSHALHPSRKGHYFPNTYVPGITNPLKSGLNHKEISLFSLLGLEWVHEASCNWMSGKCPEETLSEDISRKVGVPSKTELVPTARQTIGDRGALGTVKTHWSSWGSAKPEFYASSHPECAKWLLSHSQVLVQLYLVTLPSNTWLCVSPVH